MTVIDVNIVKLAALLSKNAKNLSCFERNGCTDNDYRANRNLEKYREIAGNFEIYSALPAQQKLKLKIINRVVNKRVDNLRFWKMYLNRFVIRRRNFGTFLFRKRQKLQKPQGNFSQINAKCPRSEWCCLQKVSIQFFMQMYIFCTTSWFVLLPWK